MCYSTSLVSVLDLGTQALTGIFPQSREQDVPSGPLTLIKCMDCGLVQLAHNYDLSMLYGDTYGYRSGLNPSMVRHLSSKVASIENIVQLQTGDLVLDIGSNDGTLLGSYQTDNLRRVGIDPSGPKFFKYYAPDIELIPEFFAAEAVRSKVGQQQAKVITSIAMFYDLERPADFVKEIIEVLDDNGIWVLEQSYLPTMIATHSYDTVCHEHLEYYTLKQIVSLLSQHGLRIIDVEMNDVNGGSFAVAVAKQGSRYRDASAVVDRILEQEAAAGYDTTKPFRSLQQVMTQHREELRALLEGIHYRGEKVIGYGASTKGNVLLQYCGIDSQLLPVIAEVNEDKFGACTPGTKIPIISEREARAMEPDYFLVLPWHFREHIVHKESLFLNGGGKLIFPLPELDVFGRTAEALVGRASP
jgi:hypothetical protein